MLKRKIRFPVKPVITGSIILIALFLISSAVKALKNLDYFKVSEVVANRSEQGLDFSYLVGRNIFSLNLDRESSYIAQLYPAYKKVSIFRILPERLFIVFTERKPMAYVKLYRYFFTDRDQVLFGTPAGVQEDSLPVITGLETKIFGVKPGKRYNIAELSEALRIIDTFALHKALKEYRIKRIEVGQLANASLSLQLPDYLKAKASPVPALLEVKVGQGDIGDKIGVLADLLNQMKKDASNIKYIDLRFKEPVIKLKDAK